MATLHEIHDLMAAYNGQVAYGSECNAWGDFVENSYAEYKVGPWSDASHDMQVSEEFAEFWSAVAKGESDQYAADTGDRITA